MSAPVTRLLAFMADRPSWPDVEPALRALRRRHRLGIVSNVDDDILAETRLRPIIDSADVLTAQRLGWSKPDAHIHRLATTGFGVRLERL